MSLRWIQETQEAPTCDEESSDIGDSSDDSFDTDVSLHGDDNDSETDENLRRKKRENIRPPTTSVVRHSNGTFTYDTEQSDAKYDNQEPEENPVNGGSDVQLYFRTGHHLAITAQGGVEGLKNNCEPHARLRLTKISFGVYRIQGIETGLYLAFNEKGQLYGERDENEDNTEWEMWKIGKYQSFRSHKYEERGWWVGIKKSGRAKPGPKTAWAQKAIQFIPQTLE